MGTGAEPGGVDEQDPFGYRAGRRALDRARLPAVVLFAVAATVAVVVVFGGGDGAADPLSDDILPALPSDLSVVGGRETVCESTDAARECHRIVAVAAEQGDLEATAARVTGLFTVGEWGMCGAAWEIDGGPCVVAIDSLAKWAGGDTTCEARCDAAVAVLLVDSSSR